MYKNTKTIKEKEKATCDICNITIDKKYYDKHKNNC